jgi:hypothetical protein
VHQADPAQFEDTQVPRRSDRVERALVAAVCRDGRPDAEVTLDNLSPLGFRMSAVAGLKAYAFFYLKVGPELRFPAQVRWCQDGFAGCEFPRGLTSRQYLQLLRSAGAEGDELPRLNWVSRLRNIFSR